MIAARAGKGDRVGVWSPNRAEWALTQYATAKLGVILVNINPAYRLHELEYALGQSGLPLALRRPGAEGRRTSSRWSTTSRARVPDARARDLLRHRRVGARSPTARPTRTQLRRRMAELDFDDPINIQYTSGTTGFPKGATLTHHNILNNGYFTGELLGYSERDRVCIPVPLYHCFGMVLGNLGRDLARAVHGLPGGDVRARGDAPGVRRGALHEPLRRADDVHRRARPRPSSPSFDLSSLRTGIMAGSPCPIEVMKRVSSDMGIERDGDRVRDDRDLAGDDPGASRRHARESLRHRRQVMPHTEIKIVDPATGRTLPRGEPGEFLRPRLRGDARLLERPGAHRRGDRRSSAGCTPATWRRWTTTGYVRIVGRIKDMVIRGGENVYPREIEEFLYTHPEIADVQVIGVPDERYGEELMAWVVPRPGASLTHRGRARVLPRPDRALQDPALRQVRRLVPDDGHRQGPEVQDARDRDRRARARAGGGVATA